MKCTSCASFSPSEQVINKRLGQLFESWVTGLKEKRFWDKYNEEYFVTDGIFPGYLSQHPKILFIGKEVLDIAGHSYVDIFYKAIREKMVGGKNINQHLLYKRMLKIAYGLAHECPEWTQIPKASDIAETFGEEGGSSFAFMNISKLSHELLDNPAWQTDIGGVSDFVRQTLECNRNYIHEEVEIIRPDLVITMNLGNWLPSLGDIDFQETLPEVDVYTIKLEGQNIPLFNTWHFSAIKRDIEFFYAPICSAWEKYGKG